MRRVRFLLLRFAIRTESASFSSGDIPIDRAVCALYKAQRSRRKDCLSAALEARLISAAKRPGESARSVSRVRSGTGRRAQAGCLAAVSSAPHGSRRSQARHGRNRRAILSSLQKGFALTPPSTRGNAAALRNKSVFLPERSAQGDHKTSRSEYSTALTTMTPPFKFKKFILHRVKIAAQLFNATRWKTSAARIFAPAFFLYPILEIGGTVAKRRILCKLRFHLREYNRLPCFT